MRRPRGVSGWFVEALYWIGWLIVGAFGLAALWYVGNMVYFLFFWRG